MAELERRNAVIEIEAAQLERDRVALHAERASEKDRDDRRSWANGTRVRETQPPTEPPAASHRSP